MANTCSGINLILFEIRLRNEFVNGTRRIEMSCLCKSCATKICTDLRELVNWEALRYKTYTNNLNVPGAPPLAAAIIDAKREYKIIKARLDACTHTTRCAQQQDCVICTLVKNS